MLRRGAFRALRFLQCHISTALTVGFGLALIAVPTVFTVLPELSEDASFRQRTAIVVGWMLVAFVIVLGNTAREGVLAKALDERAVERGLRMQAAEATIITSLLAPTQTPQGIPRQYDFELYVYDDSLDLLIPAWPRYGDLPIGDLDDPRIFQPGKGATGRAWNARSTTYVSGDPVADGAYDLTEDQQRIYARRRVVCSALVQGVSGQPVGVLTALGDRDDDHFTPGRPGQAALEKLAATIGVTLDRLTVTPSS